MWECSPSASVYGVSRNASRIWEGYGKDMGTLWEATAKGTSSILPT